MAVTKLGKLYLGIISDFVRSLNCPQFVLSVGEINFYTTLWSGEVMKRPKGYLSLCTIPLRV